MTVDTYNFGNVHDTVASFVMESDTDNEQSSEQQHGTSLRPSFGDVQALRKNRNILRELVTIISDNSNNFWFK